MRQLKVRDGAAEYCHPFVDLCHAAETRDARSILQANSPVTVRELRMGLLCERHR